MFGAVVQRGSDRCCDRCGLGRNHVHLHRSKFALASFFSAGCGSPRRLECGLQGLVKRGGGRHIGARRAQRRGGFAAPFPVSGIVRGSGLQPRQCLPGLDEPAVHPLLLLALGLHGGIEAAAQFGEGGMLVRAEKVRVERLPIAVQCDEVVRRRQRLAGQRGGGIDQGLRPGASLALRHGRDPAQPGGAVDPAVVAAQRALGSLQRVFGVQRGDGGAADVEWRSRLHDLQQRAVIALRRCQPPGPVGPRDFGLRQLSLDRLARVKNGAGSCRCGCGRRAATFLEEPAQHRMGVQGWRQTWGAGMREPQCKRPTSQAPDAHDNPAATRSSTARVNAPQQRPQRRQ